MQSALQEFRNLTWTGARFVKPLDEYRRKRRFGQTPEPQGKPARRRRSALKFVVQKHAASRLHYDFRLELDGVLKSWAVPKGPSYDPGEKRLAVQVEDHPLEYGQFEGIIPPGEYGGGTVLIWDRGTWLPSDDPAAGFRQGKLKFTLAGKKLHGGWTLVRMGPSSGDEQKNWLLIKERDEFARASEQEEITVSAPESVASHRNLKQIAASSKRVWRSTSETSKSMPRKAVRGTATRVKSKQSNARGSAPPELVAGVRLTHPDRVVFPGQGVTKADLAAYYVDIADWILPHLHDRPLSLVRCPRGEGEKCFYQKHPGSSAPETLEQIQVPEKEGRKPYAVVNDLAGLISLVQIGVLEIHPWGARSDRLDRPDRLIFDLDPGPDVPWRRVIKAAHELRELLADLQLQSFVKTTGGKGLHVVVPVDRHHEWSLAKQFTAAVVAALERRWPGDFTTNMSKSRRGGKIFLDYLRNDRGATAVAPYSTRARPGGPVAVPIAWEELNPKLRSDHFNVGNVAKRLAALRHDPWANLATTRQRITLAAAEQLEDL